MPSDRPAPPEVEPTEAEWKLAQSVYLGACICGNTSGDGLVCGKHVAVAHALAAHRASVSAEAGEIIAALLDDDATHPMKAKLRARAFLATKGADNA